LSSQILLSGGDKYYSYSGEIFGDVSAPATIPMITIDNTGLRDSMIIVQPFYGRENNDSGGNILGIQIKLDGIVIVNQQAAVAGAYSIRNQTDFNLFAPRNSKLEVISLNTSGNNVQIRGANLLGYYL
jgi:hypothetical protein